MDSQQLKLILATAVASSSLTYFILNQAKSADKDKDQQQGSKNGKESLAMRLARSNIKSLQPYRCARDDYDSGVLLDANEVSFE